MSGGDREAGAAAPVRLEVPLTAAGSRLDRFLVGALPGHSRAALQAWVRQGAVRVDGRPGRPGARLRGGEQVEVTPPPVRPARLAAVPMPLAVRHRDGDLLVLVKPAGMVVHPGAGTRSPTLASGLLAMGIGLSGIGGEERPGIVHRLDRDTSGLMVVACHDAAHRALAEAFRERRVHKEYRAICWGRLRQLRGVIDLPIGRDPVRRTTMSPRGKRARPARTHYRVLEHRAGLSLVGIVLETGRTHQIRSHLRALGHPVVGDRAYGGAGWRSLRHPGLREAMRGFPRLALHAWRLGFPHPIRPGWMEFCEEPDVAFQGLLAAMRAGEPA